MHDLRVRVDGTGVLLRDPFDDEGNLARRRAADLALLAMHAAAGHMHDAEHEAHDALVDAHVAAERLEHATRTLRIWTARTWVWLIRCERARAAAHQ